MQEKKLKFALIFIVLLLFILSAGTVALVMHYTKQPIEQIDENKQFTYPTKIFGDFKRENNKTKNTRDKIKNKNYSISENEFVSEIMNSWQNRVKTATSSQIATTTNNTKNTESAQSVSTNNILKKINERFHSQNTGENDEIDEIISIYTHASGGEYSKVIIPALVEEDMELHKYGNTLASIISSYQNIMGDQEKTLGSFIKNQSHVNAQSILNLANKYEKLSEKIALINSPEKISDANIALSASVNDLSKELRKLASKNTEETLYSQILSYNKSSENMAKNLLIILDTFSANGVKFKETESGSIFNMPKLNSF